MNAYRYLLWAALAFAISSLGVACGKDDPKGQAAASGVLLHGAGSTFSAPLYKKWNEEYQRRSPQVGLSYDAIGSGEGTKRFMDGVVDFGASDAAMSDEQIAAVSRGVQLIPTTAGIIVLAYNLDGLGGDLKLKRNVYVDIFLGKITKWNDARIRELNPTLQLPDKDIVPVVRQDGSGTTYAFTNHLSTISEEWRSGPGTGTTVNWPNRVMKVPGNEGVAERIKISEGALGYVEYGFAERTGIAMAWLENKEGAFVQPHTGSGLATLLNVELPNNLRAFFPDPAGKDSYPIVTYSWMLLYKKYDNPQKLAALKQYMKWNLTVGQEFGGALGYIRLPPAVADRALAAVESLS